MEPYEVVFDSRDEDEFFSRAFAVVMSLSQEKRDRLAAGDTVSVLVPECFEFKYYVLVDSEDVVWVGRK